MREFNTSGPCNPALHYTVMRAALIAEGQEKVRKGAYFTIFAPRQTGKTTYFRLLLAELKEEGFVPIWISFENLKRVTKERFYQALSHRLRRELALHGLKTDDTIQDAFDLGRFFEKLHSQAQPIVLVIDEFEGIPDGVLSEVMHTFRDIYHQKEIYALHSLILVGVSTIAELVMSTASPFNIAAELQVPYFTFVEVNDLINQYVTESRQPFAEKVIEAIYNNTQGQPGLVCALCLHLVTKIATDKSHPVTTDDFYITLNVFLTKPEVLHLNSSMHDYNY